MESSVESTTAIKRSTVSDNVVVLTLDMPGKSANVMTQSVLDELEQQIDALESAEVGEISGLIIASGKPRIFVAGADLKLISDSLDWPAERIIQFCRHGQKLYERIGKLSFPSVAAIHGVCVGGGLELALACDFRVCSDAHLSTSLAEGRCPRTASLHRTVAKILPQIDCE